MQMKHYWTGFASGFLAAALIVAALEDRIIQLERIIEERTGD